MTQEEKELLLKDLCARLPYGVIVHNTLGEFDINLKERLYCLPTALTTNFKPYLRPMSSMTEEEKKEYCDLQDKFLCSSQYLVTDAYELFDWLNAHYFDYRNLIEKELAFEALEEMYKK